jgi:ParB family transcriptional regulator, chromosome partitioning protein
MKNPSAALPRGEAFIEVMKAQAAPAAQDRGVRKIDVGLIYPSNISRPIDAKKVADLAASIKDVGLINPISVRAGVHHRGTTPFDAFDIIAGHHRYRAVCTLKWATVPCIVLDLDDLHAELAEIDENLMRSELTATQEAGAIWRRKRIYEQLHPETKAGVAGGTARQGAANDKLSFADATADATGKDKRTIERAAARGKALGDDLRAVEGTSLDKGVELNALAKMPAADRQHVIQRAVAGEQVSARKQLLADVVKASKEQRPRSFDPAPCIELLRQAIRAYADEIATDRERGPGATSHQIGYEAKVLQIASSPYLDRHSLGEFVQRFFHTI